MDVDNILLYPSLSLQFISLEEELSIAWVVSLGQFQGEAIQYGFGGILSWADFRALLSEIRFIRLYYRVLEDSLLGELEAEASEETDKCVSKWEVSWFNPALFRSQFRPAPHFTKKTSITSFSAKKG